METIKKEKFVPIEAVHPTELIKDELKARGMQKKELAERLGMKASNFSRFLSAKENITPAMALKLEDALGISADYWMGLQLSYERDVEAIRQEENRADARTGLKKQLQPLLSVISWAEISRSYFGRSNSWLYHKLNGIDGNGKPTSFNEDERSRLKAALLDLSSRIADTANSL